MASVSVKLTLFRMGLLMDGGEEQKDPISKICDTYLTWHSYT